MTGHVIYLLRINGAPCAWATSRDDAIALADNLRARARDRGFTDSYDVVGITDSPFGDPEADTLARPVDTQLTKLTKAFQDFKTALHARRDTMPRDAWNALWSAVKRTEYLWVK